MWWLGEMRAAGLAALAWVYPPTFAARKSTDALMLPITQPLIATFNDLASAYDWLRSQRP
jgi:hypothetical protein